MYWNIFVLPKFRRSKAVDVCVTTFECNDEELVRSLFYKRHVGMDIVTTSSHPTLELAYKQIHMMGTAVKGHFQFWEESMMCDECGLHSVGSMSDKHLCDFCHMEKEYEKKHGPWRSDHP